MKNRCVIIAGGDCEARLLECIGDSDFIIAADSGLNHCKAKHIKPHLVVGDFDSYFGQLPEEVETLKLPTHKDDTDLLFAARCGVERGFKEFTILGGYGSRPDQNFAMYQTLVWLVDTVSDAEVSAVCNGFEVFAIKNSSKVFNCNPNKYLSVFTVNGDASGVDIIGAEYPLENATVTHNFPIGVSNCAVSDTTVSVKNGTLLIMLVDKAL